MMYIFEAVLESPMNGSNTTVRRYYIADNEQTVRNFVREELRNSLEPSIRKIGTISIEDQGALEQLLSAGFGSRAKLAYTVVTTTDKKGRIVHHDGG